MRGSIPCLGCWGFSENACRSCSARHAEGFIAEVAARRGVPAECVLPGAGSSSLLFTCLPRLLRDGASALILAPMYSEYEHSVGTLLGGVVRYHALRPEDGFAVDGDEFLREVQRIQPDAVLLVNPNNPTGRLWPRAEIIRFLDQLPAGTLVVVDEEYLDYAGAAESLEQEAAIREDLVIVKSMSKVYGLSGARGLPGDERESGGTSEALAASVAGGASFAGGGGSVAGTRLLRSPLRRDSPLERRSSEYAHARGSR
jgi:hypothetical protein